MGVTYELMGDYPRALDCYRQAAASEDADDRLPVYLDAKNRLADRISRILPPQPAVIMQEQAEPSDASTQPPNGDGSAPESPPQ